MKVLTCTGYQSYPNSDRVGSQHNRLYFEAAVGANLYAPNYAFNQACIAAGLPLQEWADQFRLSELGYYEVDE